MKAQAHVVVTQESQGAKYNKVLYETTVPDDGVVPILTQSTSDGDIVVVVGYPNTSPTDFAPNAMQTCVYCEALDVQCCPLK